MNEKTDAIAKANAHLNAAGLPTYDDLLETVRAAYRWIDHAEAHFINKVSGGEAIQTDLGAGTIFELAPKIDEVLAKAALDRGSRRAA